MRKLLIAVAMLACSHASAWDGNPNTMPQWHAPVPQYHFNPQSRLDVMENAIIENQMMAGAAISRMRPRGATLTQAQIEESNRRADRESCEDLKIILLVPTLLLSSLYDCD